MKILWESRNWSGAAIEPTITCLAWMKSPSKENKGLLAVGSESGVVGITYTDLVPDTQCTKRYNFNLRGHHSAIGHVSWNKPQSKLVSCDVSGFIYVWIPNDERWSVELVNDRGVKVRDFCWSPNGTATLICYEDNFVLIGTASGQRVWSNNYDVTVLCGAWSPNSEEVVMGFSSGSIQVLNEHGNIIHEREIFHVPVSKVAFSPIRESDKKWTLAACSSTDEIIFANTYYEIEPFSYQSYDPVLKIEWSANGTMLAVVCTCNRVTILSYKGEVLHSFAAPLSKSPLTAFTWAHDDVAVIVAAGGHLAVGRVVPGVPRLSQLVNYQLWISLGRNTDSVDTLSLPPREKEVLKHFDHHIIRCRVPKSNEIFKAITMPTDWRWYCTIVPVPRKSYHYMLCMEHMGGLVPILLGRQINRIIPQFLISLPPHLHRREESRSRFENGSSAQVEDLTTFRRESNQRTSLWRQSKRQFRKFMNKRVAPRSSKNPPTLVQVSSNVWCTKFKITAPGIKEFPHFLANVVYKTSVLHLQPRQMTIHLADLKDQGEVPSAHKSGSGTPVRTPEKKLKPKTNESPRESETQSQNLTTKNTNVNLLRNLNQADEFQRLLDNDILNNEIEGNTMEFDDDQETELLAEEKEFYNTVLTEFDGLKQALNQHIERMKRVAIELEQLSSKKNNSSNQSSIMELLRRRSLQSIPRSPRNQTNEETTRSEHGPRPSTSSGVPQDGRWHERIEDIGFIDEDENFAADDGRNLLHGDKRTRRNLGEISSKKKQKQLNDIRAVVEKLSLMADELAVRSPNIHSRNPSANLRVGNNAVGSKASPNLKQEGASDMTVAQLRAEVRSIAQQVSQIEEKITIDMLNDIRGDLQQRVQHIKAVLGEPLLNESVSKCQAKPRMLTMSNKTPFWNEQTQVYQLDFGGRVTQESAKNFQIEYNSEQVMQFGRIENGAYTLDFRQPFSAIQAFAIALASITQRLK